MIGYKNLFFSAAGEPTGNLDTKRSEEIGEVLKTPTRSLKKDHYGKCRR
jgi:ABC-type lipoprotein export system ATPase subunit